MFQFLLWESWNRYPNGFHRQLIYTVFQYCNLPPIHSAGSLSYRSLSSFSLLYHQQSLNQLNRCKYHHIQWKAIAWYHQTSYRYYLDVLRLSFLLQLQVHFFISYRHCYKRQWMWTAEVRLSIIDEIRPLNLDVLQKTIFQETAYCP